LGAYLRVWTERHVHSTVLDRLPHTFCHLDAFPRNCSIHRSWDGTRELVLIDWELAGIAAVGEELAPLLVASVWLMELSLADARHAQQEVLDSYVEGLRDAGWRGDAALVQTGYRIAAGLRYGVGGVPVFLPILLDEQRHPGLERLLSQPFPTIISNIAAVNEWMADLLLRGGHVSEGQVTSVTRSHPDSEEGLGCRGEFGCVSTVHAHFANRSTPDSPGGRPSYPPP
jgi:hypothetical protein